MNIKRYCALLITALAYMVANAASFSVSAPPQVIKGSKFSISYELRNASGSSFQCSNVGGCTLLFGPSTSQSSSMVVVNGRSSSSSSETYTMTYRADKVGTYRVGAASIHVGGKVYRTRPFTIQVLPPDKTTARGRNQSVQVYDIDSQTPDKRVGKNDVFVRIILSKSRAYEQEGLLCTIKLYTKYNIQQFIPTIQPSFNGFISQEVPITSSINRIENYKGQNYMVADLKQCILFPQQSGKLTITSGNYDLTVVQYETYRSMFGMMRRPIEKQLKVKSNSASIMIDPLPQPQPADFSGAVGNFSVSSAMLNNNLRTNESGTLRLTIRGTGNLKNIKTPTIKFPTQFDAYDPQTTVNASPSGNTLTGKVVIDYAFVPQYVGEFEIPASSFSYFNTSTHRYERLNLKGYHLDVAKGSSSGGQDNDPGVQKDVRNIQRGDLGLVKKGDLLMFTWTYTLWYLIPVILFIVVLFYYRSAIKARANVTLMKTKRASRVASKRLRTARQLMVKQQRDRFYEEMLRALWGYLSDKLTIPVSELNRENVVNELLKYGISQELGNHIIELLDKCEFARYAKAEDGGDMSDVYNEACDYIDQVENTKKRK